MTWASGSGSYRRGRRWTWVNETRTETGPVPVRSIFVALISPAGGESAGTLVGVLSLGMNDVAVHALGFLSGLSGVDPPGGLAAAFGRSRRGASSAAARSWFGPTSQRAEAAVHER
jgi:hypothetical protein